MILIFCQAVNFTLNSTRQPNLALNAPCIESTGLGSLNLKRATSMLLPLSIPQPGARNYVWRFILLLRTGSRGICCCFRHSTSGVQLTTLLRNYKGLTSLLPVQNCVFTLIVKLSKSKELYVEKKYKLLCQPAQRGGRTAASITAQYNQNLFYIQFHFILQFSFLSSTGSEI